MEITVIRKEFLNDRTIGELYLNDSLFCYTMEDKDRGVDEDDSKATIMKNKVPKQTAVPYGRYRVILSYSVKLKRYLPLLLDVPSWTGIRLHRGTLPSSSSGCVCVGMKKKGVILQAAVEAEKALIGALDKVNKSEAIYITIKKHHP